MEFDDSAAQLKAISTYKSNLSILYDCLNSLAMSLVMGMEVYLRRFESGNAFPLLVSIAAKQVKNPAAGDVMVMLWRCTSLIMEHVPASCEGAAEYHKTIIELASTSLHTALIGKWKYTEMNDSFMLEECLRNIRFVFKDDVTGEMVKHALVGDLLTLCTHENSLIARQALETISTMCAKVVMPPEFEKESGVSSFLKLFKGSKKSSRSSKAHHDPSLALHADHPVVVIVENVLAPFLISLVEQFYESMKSGSLDTWTYLEMTMQCLGSLIERCFICHRSSSAKTLITKDMARIVFSIINMIESIVSIEQSVKNDRVLFCETLLAIFVNCNRELMLETLLDENAKTFLLHILDDSSGDTSTLLEDPFPRTGFATKNTQRRDKDHITSMAAVRLFVLACPTVPPDAFGLKPKVVLPVHQWLWEDEVHHFNRLGEEQCLSLETCWTRLKKDGYVSIHMKELTADLRSMTMSKSTSGVRNISRSFAPFIYHFADEVSLRPVARVKEAGPDCVDDDERRDRAAAKDGVVLNTSVSVPSRHVAVGEVYFSIICTYAAHVPGQMVKQLATCAAASILQLILLSGDEKRVTALMTSSMLPMCEMFRETLISGDKATKAVVLTMIHWLLYHKSTCRLDFPITAVRCGLFQQLQIASSKESVVVTSRDGKPTRTLQLAETSGELYRVIASRVKESTSKRAELVKDTAALKTAVGDLRAVVSTDGVHQSVLENLFLALVHCEHTTPYEIMQMGLAPTLLQYLLNGETIDNILNEGVVYSSAGSGSTASRMSTSMAESPLEPKASTWVSHLSNGARMKDVLLENVNEERLQYLKSLGVSHSNHMRQLVVGLSATLGLLNDLSFPLVESVITYDKVSCKPPLQVYKLASVISPNVTVCGDAGELVTASTLSTTTDVSRIASRSNSTVQRGMLVVASHESSLTGPPTVTAVPLRSNASPAATSTPAGASHEVPSTVVPPKEMCMEGHKLQHVKNYTTSAFCDVCNKQMKSGYCCRPCDFDICGSCYKTYEGRTPHKILQRRNRAHLLVSVADIERYFRTGSTTTKATQIAPTSMSSLHNLNRFYARVECLLMREAEFGLNSPTSGKLLSNKELLLSVMYAVLSSHHTRGVLPNKPEHYEEYIQPVEEECPDRLTEKELEEAKRIVAEGMEEKYNLYYPETGLCPLNESFISVLYRQAFHRGDRVVLQQLENLIMRREGPSTTITFPQSREASPVKVADQPGEEHQELKSEKQIVFHHFDSDSFSQCSCGQHSRASFDTSKTPALTFGLPNIARRCDMLLLILIYKIFYEDDDVEKKLFTSIFRDQHVFVNTTITNSVIKSLEASALRVALLPLRFAVPQWTYFVLTNARFLLPFAAREKIARFLAYKCRRSLIQYMRCFKQYRQERGIFIVPSEWARLANHKYTVNRDNFLDSAYVALRKTADSRLPISFEFAGDVGAGQGPTAQFYTQLAQEACRAGLKLWRGAGSQEQSSKKKAGPSVHRVPTLVNGTEDSLVVPPVEGLYPDLLTAPEKSTQAKETNTLTSRVTALDDYCQDRRKWAKALYAIGVALGRAFVDEQVFPIQLSSALSVFLRKGLPPHKVCFEESFVRDRMPHAEQPIDLLRLTLLSLKLVDRSAANSIAALSKLDAQSLKELEIPFTLPGRDNWELIRDGAKTLVEASNLPHYQQRVVSALVYEGCAQALRLLMTGFRDVVPHEAMELFEVNEVLGQLCGDDRSENEPLWTAEEAKSILVGDHGYQNDSAQLSMLSNIIANRLTPKEQRAFLLFCTGCPRLPPGGLSALGAITVVKRSNAFDVARSLARQTLSTPIIQQQEGDDDDLEGSPLTLAMRDRSPEGDGDDPAEDPPPEDSGSSTTDVEGQSDLTQNGAMTNSSICQDDITQNMLSTDWSLPSVNTCFKYLKLPPYPEEELMYEKLLLAINHCTESFELS